MSNLKVQPSYGLWARHVNGLTVTNSSFNYERTDNRYPLFLDDVTGAKITNVKMVKSLEVGAAIKLKNSNNVQVDKAIYYVHEWGKSPTAVTEVNSLKVLGSIGFSSQSISSVNR